MSDYFVGPISPRDKRRQAQMDALLAQEGIARDKNLSYSAGIFDDDGQMIAKAVFLLVWRKVAGAVFSL